MRRQLPRFSENYFLPASFEAGCIVFVISYLFFLACWLLFTYPLRLIGLVGPGLLLTFHLVMIGLSFFVEKENKKPALALLATRLFFTAAAFSPMVYFVLAGK